MRDLWAGRLPLARAFWDYAIVYGTCANVAATGAAFAALALGLPGWLVLVLFFLPLPYLVVAVIGVFRSAERYEGPPARAAWIKAAVVVWAALMVAL